MNITTRHIELGQELAEICGICGKKGITLQGRDWRCWPKEPKPSVLLYSFERALEVLREWGYDCFNLTGTGNEWSLLVYKSGTTDEESPAVSVIGSDPTECGLQALIEAVKESP